MRRAITIALTFLIAGQTLAAAPSQQAIQLRNQGIAELENESPVRAEATFLELAKLIPDDPLPPANLAIATLRQQRFEDAQSWIDKGFALAPHDARLTAIQAEIHHWSGNSLAALEAFRKAADTLPETVDYQYSLYRQATSTNDPSAPDAARVALTRLSQLRPENLVVLLQLGQQARTDNDRATASSVYLRIRELIWQAPRGGDQLLERILQGLEEGSDLASLRSSALRLENVLKISPMYKEGLRELSSGIQGIPLLYLLGEPSPAGWTASAGTVAVTFRGHSLDQRANSGAALAVGDLDGDEQPEIVRLVGRPAEIHIMQSGDPESTIVATAPEGLERLELVDLDNDGRQDVLAFGPGGSAVWTLAEGGVLRNTTEAFLPAGAAGRAAAIIDFDIEGDLDVLLAGESIHLLRNALEGVLDDVADRSLPALELPSIRDAMASDLDRDGDLDILLAHASGLSWLDNLRQGRFADRSSDIAPAGPAQRAIAADFDNDGLTDLVTAGRGISFFRNTGERFAAWNEGAVDAPFEPVALAVFDADNDGSLDVAVGGAGGVAVFAQRDGTYERLELETEAKGVTALAARDLDGDGDLDLLADGSSGIVRLDNQGGNRNRYLSIRLRGLNKGNSKNNVFGLGAALEVKAGSAYQFREATGEIVHFGLGSVATPDLLRVVWTNGVPQNRLQPETNQRIVEEQLLKGSCPFLYVRSDGGFEFVTDLLWGAPAGLPVGEGVYLGADPQELIRIGGLDSPSESYEIRITEELWEAAFFDRLRLWVVDHPKALEVASSLRIIPGQSTPELVHASRRVRPVVAAWDASGRDVTRRVMLRDEVYADGWQRSSWQGVATEPWAFTFDLGESPGVPIRLHLDGWIFPTDASLNLALAQREGPAPIPPSIEVETSDGWTPLIPSMGFPAGKTKTMIVDTPALPPGSSRLRIVSGQWLSWDRIAWTDQPADSETQLVAKLDPERAALRYRGFSRVVRKAPNAPHSFDYQETRTASPWLPFPGRYTRYGDVKALLTESDDRSVIMGPGDEMAIVFDTSALPPVASGQRRTLFLESHGWDKDADRNTGEGLQVGPLPFRAMSGYPYGPDEAFPDTPLHREYVETWLTRIVEPELQRRAGATIAP